MPPLNPNLIRSGLAKSVAHGYFQSVVAVSHPHLLNANNRPSFSKRQSNRFSRLHTLHAQAASAFHAEKHATVQAAGLADKRHARTTSHGGIDAYLEALRKKDADAAEEDAEEQEWSTVKFQNKIEWKPSPASILLGDAKPTGESDAAQDGAPELSLHPDDEAALAHIDAALEVEARKRLEAIEEAEPGETDLKSTTPLASAPVSRSRTPDLERSYTPASVARSATPPVDSQSQAFADHLQSLSDTGRFQEIPAVFEAMLAANVRPIAPAYNAYLTAMINLSPRRNEVVSKSMAVYTKMLKERVAPNSSTYNILVDLLASRSLEVASLKHGLEEKRVRFGGFDESGKFMLASHELEFAILSEDDWLDVALKLFNSSAASGKIEYEASTYHMIISACASAGRTAEMLRIFEHMEAKQVKPFGATFPAMITAFAKSGDLVSAVECYDEYKALAVANNEGQKTLHGRDDAHVYASVIHAYIFSNKLDGAQKFYAKITEAYGPSLAGMHDAIVTGGFVEAFLQRGIYQDALQWAMSIEPAARAKTMSRIATAAADRGDGPTAVAAFAQIPLGFADIAAPSVALLALSVRQGDVAAATRYWHVLNSPAVAPTSALIEPTIMYAIGLMLRGQVADGLRQSELMFDKIRVAEAARTQTAEEIEEGIAYIARFMSAQGISDPRDTTSEISSAPQQSFVTSPYPSTPTVSSIEENFDPHAQSTDFKGSAMISDLLDGSHGYRGSRLNDALGRFKNMRRAGRHPRYITYAKLISAAAREGKSELCHDILAMARSDVPLLAQYPVVRYGWSSILDAMIGACLSFGNRTMAEQFHQELLSFGATPTANTYGLYITTLKESTKTFDEASEAVRIFHRARAEGVEPSSFLYNALIGKLGKARRIDDCLLYFTEMRRLGVKPTSVTYGTIVNALCRVSDEKLAEELFDEMESVPNYKARPAPYNSMMQFFLTTKRDKSKVLAYYERMKARGIAPTSHTYKLLMDTHASLEPVDLKAAEDVLSIIRSSGMRPEPVHYASLIHARGCVLHDLDGAWKTFNTVLSEKAVPINASIFQAMFEAIVANHRVADTDGLLELMERKNVALTPYIANSLIHGWAAEKKINKSRSIYDALGAEKREPSTYEAMTRAFLAVEQREKAEGVVSEMLRRGYPNAVVNKTLELLSGGEEVAA